MKVTTEHELIQKITKLKKELKETREILDKLRKAKKNAKFELSPNQIKNLRNKGYNVKIKTK